MLSTTGLLKIGGLKESHDFRLLCVDLHTISYAVFLADIYDGWNLAGAGGHKREDINVK